MFYLENYGRYAEIIEKGSTVVNISEITKDNWVQHYQWILNILKDAIETDYVRHPNIKLVFDNGMDVDLSIPDYYFNLIMFPLILESDNKIQPNHIFFDETITIPKIKSYIDKYFIDESITKINNIRLNNIIDNHICAFRDIDTFSGYLSNTLNLHDFIRLMNENSEFDSLIHADLSNVPISDVIKVGMEHANRSIDIIKEDSEHCLANFFKANEGVSPKQYKEVTINIGSKPDGRGEVYPTIINTNFLLGGVNDILSFAMEENNGRNAQVIVDGSVGDSGYFARLLGLNNTDSFINPDPHYSCNTKNFQELIIKDSKVLNKLKNRYYRLNPNGIEYKIQENDTSLIGKKIYLRSPMTCESAANGKGICYKCYGNLAFINSDINIGKLASEMVSSVLTQKKLSAKHILESAVVEMKWTPEFHNIFIVEYNMIKVQEGINLKGYKLIIDPDDILIDNEDESNLEFNEYINQFEILTPKNKSIMIYTKDYDNMYISVELNEIIREKATSIDDKLCINLEDLEDTFLFAMQIHNNDLSKTLKNVNDILDKSETIKNLNRHQWLQCVLDRIIESGLNVDSVHLEVILMNQLRNIDNILDTPKWEYPNEECTMLTLKQALGNHPSVTIGLSYQNIKKMFYNPLTFKKNKPSFMDLFFMEKPQLYLTEDKYIKENKEDSNELKFVITRDNKNNKKEEEK